MSHARIEETTVEDLQFLIDHNVGLTDAARRAGFPSAGALEKWLRDHCRPDLVRQLRARDWDPLTPSTKAMHMGRTA